jgi:hypothetical protein
VETFFLATGLHVKIFNGSSIDPEYNPTQVHQRHGLMACFFVRVINAVRTVIPHMHSNALTLLMMSFSSDIHSFYAIT